MYKKILTIAGLVGVGVLGRLVPHAPNATPITAITLAARRHVGRVWAFVVPMAAMVLSDMVLGFYNWKVLASVYGSFLLIALLSHFLQKSSSPFAPVAFAVAGALLFFITTNFAVWVLSPWYEKSFAGLLYCYTLGLPFLRNMLLGDVAYTVALFSVFTIPTRAPQHTEKLLCKVQSYKGPTYGAREHGSTYGA